MNPHEVVEILGDPEELTFPLDHLTVEYWSVPVVMRQEREEFESTVTFETMEEANKLRVGDIFMRGIVTV